MSIFDLFKKGDAPKKYDYSVSMDKMQQIQKEDDKEIEFLAKADNAFNLNGNLDERIKAYEKVVSKKTHWNSFNQCMSLAQMYVKAGRNNDAWGYLNQIDIWFSDPRGPQGNRAKIRQLQFKILKSEKKYKDAFNMLVAAYVRTAYVTNQPFYFNKEKFIKEAKTTAKEIGMTEQQLANFANEFERRLKKSHLDEMKARDFCSEYFRNYNL